MKKQDKNQYIGHYHLYQKVSDGRKSARRLRFNPWVRKVPLTREWQPTPFLPEEFHEQKSLVGYSPWSLKELDTIERLTHTHTHTFVFAQKTSWKTQNAKRSRVQVGGILFVIGVYVLLLIIFLNGYFCMCKISQSDFIIGLPVLLQFLTLED